MFNEYPYVNIQDVNLDWILKHIKDLETNLKDFVKLNTIKYADPIIWNITKQYETNTVVIDGNTGTAYLSVQPVPAGVALNNTDYWTVIFTLNLTTSNQNITLRDDGTNVVATFASDTGDWLLWNFYLYRVTQPISLNTAYVEGFNIERFTVELFIRDYINTLTGIIGDLDDLTTSDKTTIVDAINSLLNDINTTIGDLNDLNTSDTDNIVKAINSLLSDLSDSIGDLNDLNTTDKDSTVDAINEVLGSIGDLNDLNTTDKDSTVDAINEVLGNIGDLNNLDTTDKTSIVNAINELYGLNSGNFWHNVKDEFGAVGDAVTDDTTAIENAIAYMQTHRCGLYFPEGDYRITRTLSMDDNNNHWWVMRGAHKTETVLRADITSDSVLFDLTSAGTFRNAIISDFTIINNNANTNKNAININRLTHSIIHDIIFRGFVTSLNCQMSWCMFLFNCNFADHSTAAAQSHVILSNQCNNWTIENCQFGLPSAFNAYQLELVGPESEISIRDCTFEYGFGISLTSASAALSVVSINDCYFEWMHGYAVKSNTATTGLINNVQIENCYFNAVENDSPAYAIDSRDIDGLGVRDCYCVRFTDSMITTTNTYPTNYEFRNNTTDGIPVTRLRVHEIKGSGTSAPNTGYHHAAEIYWNALPTAGNIGWICSSDGTPGTWITFG